MSIKDKKTKNDNISKNHQNSKIYYENFDSFKQVFWNISS